jgi:hypothetical protein
MQLSDVFGHIKMVQGWEINFNDKFPFSKENFQLIQKFIKNQYNKMPDVIFTRPQWIDTCDWNAKSIDKLLDLNNLKNEDVGEGTHIYGSNVLGNNADKCYFIVR